MSRELRVLLVLLVVLVVLSICVSVISIYWMSSIARKLSSPPQVETPVVTLPAPGSYVSNGQLIYMTGFNQQGLRIPFTGGPAWLYTHGGGCAACHGPTGRGGVYPMMCSVRAPDIRYSTLAGEHGMSDEDIKRAIVEGIGENGEQLDYCMPRWQLSNSDLNDLIEYLKQLE